MRGRCSPGDKPSSGGATLHAWNGCSALAPHRPPTLPCLPPPPTASSFLLWQPSPAFSLAAADPGRQDYWNRGVQSSFGGHAALEPGRGCVCVRGAGRQLPQAALAPALPSAPPARPDEAAGGSAGPERGAGRAAKRRPGTAARTSPLPPVPRPLPGPRAAAGPAIATRVGRDPPRPASSRRAPHARTTAGGPSPAAGRDPAGPRGARQDRAPAGPGACGGRARAPGDGRRRLLAAAVGNGTGGAGEGGPRRHRHTTHQHTPTPTHPDCTLTPATQQQPPTHPPAAHRHTPRRHINTHNTPRPTHSGCTPTHTPTTPTHQTNIIVKKQLHFGEEFQMLLSLRGRTRLLIKIFYTVGLFLQSLVVVQ